jgi:hypothetical protein
VASAGKLAIVFQRGFNRIAEIPRLEEFSPAIAERRGNSRELHREKWSKPKMAQMMQSLRHIKEILWRGSLQRRIH